MTVTGVTDCAILAILRHRLHCNCTSIGGLGLRALPLLRGPVPAAPASWVASWVYSGPCSSATAGAVSGLFRRSFRGIALEICRLWLVCLGAGLGVAWGIGARGSNDSRVCKDPLRDVADSLGRPGIRPKIRPEDWVFWAWWQPQQGHFIGAPRSSFFGGRGTQHQK
jgi:hypothetical protein